jgi:hypothetical protein
MNLKLHMEDFHQSLSEIPIFSRSDSQYSSHYLRPQMDVFKNQNPATRQLTAKNPVENFVYYIMEYTLSNPIN